MSHHVYKFPSSVMIENLKLLKRTRQIILHSRIFFLETKNTGREHEVNSNNSTWQIFRFFSKIYILINKKVASKSYLSKKATEKIHSKTKLWKQKSKNNRFWKSKENILKYIKMSSTSNNFWICIRQTLGHLKLM